MKELETLPKIPTEIQVLIYALALYGIKLFLRRLKIDNGCLFYIAAIIGFISFPPLALILASYAVFNLFGFLFKSMKSKKRKRNAENLPPYTLSFEANNGDYIDVENPFRGIYIQGGAGSGKSETFIKPIIQQFSKMNMTGILYDFKNPELSDLAYTCYNLNSKIKFASVDFKNIYKSERVNPISPNYLTKYSYAFEFAKAFIYNLMPETIKKPDYWSKTSVSVLAGTMWFFKKHHPNYCTIPHIVSFILNCNAERLIEIISTDIETSGMVASLKEALDQNAGKQIAGVLGTLKTSLASLNVPEIFYVLSEDEINLNLNSPETPTFLALGSDTTLNDTYAPIISLITAVCSKLMNQSNKLPSTILLDEAPTIYIPNLEQTPATGRSNKIITIFTAQDFTQIVDKYGNDKAETIVANLGNQLYGRTTSPKTAKRISELFDKQDVYYTSYNTGKSTKGLSSSHNKGESRSVQQRDLVNIRDIIIAKPGHFFGIIAEGYYKNLLGISLKLSPIETTSIPVKNPEIDALSIFKKINSEVEQIINKDYSGQDFSLEKSKEIELDSNVDITDYMNKNDKKI